MTCGPRPKCCATGGRFVQSCVFASVHICTLICNYWIWSCRPMLLYSMIKAPKHISSSHSSLNGCVSLKSSQITTGALKLLRLDFRVVRNNRNISKYPLRLDCNIRKRSFALAANTLFFVSVHLCWKLNTNIRKDRQNFRLRIFCLCGLRTYRISWVRPAVRKVWASLRYTIDLLTWQVLVNFSTIIYGKSDNDGNI